MKHYPAANWTRGRREGRREKEREGRRKVSLEKFVCIATQPYRKLDRRTTTSASSTYHTTTTTTTTNTSTLRPSAPLGTTQRWPRNLCSISSQSYSFPYLGWVGVSVSRASTWRQHTLGRPLHTQEESRCCPRRPELWERFQTGR